MVVAERPRRAPRAALDLGTKKSGPGQWETADAVQMIEKMFSLGSLQWQRTAQTDSQRLHTRR